MQTEVCNCTYILRIKPAYLHDRLSQNYAEIFLSIP